jgi:hypothetical protein
MKSAFIAIIALLCLSAAPATKPVASVTIEAKLVESAPATAGDVVVAVRVSCREGSHELLLGSDPQVFGIYVLGPWGPVQPDLTKVRPENWMHQQHNAARRITITADRPFETKLRLADYFSVKDATAFRPGPYQLNVKFYDIGLNMPFPADSGAVRFDLAAAERPAR